MFKKLCSSAVTKPVLLVVGSSLLALAAASCTPTNEHGTPGPSIAASTMLPRPKAPTATGPFRILFVGNSHTDYYLSLPRMFGDLAAHNNVDIEIDELIEMGASLNEIYEVAKDRADSYFAMTDPDGNYYDYVVLQEKTPVALADADTYRAAVKRHADRIHQNSPGAAIYVYELMSPADFRTERSDFLEWHDEVSQNAESAARAITNAGVYRVGDAVRDAYQGAHGYRYDVGNTDRLRHGESTLHMLNDAGFLASALLYVTLFDKSPKIPESMNFSAGTGDADGQELMPVRAAVSNPAALLQIAEDNGASEAP